MIAPPAISTLTWAVVCPFVTCVTLPLSTLRALNFMGTSLFHCRRKTMLDQYGLARGRQDEPGEARRSLARSVHHRQAVFGADGDRLGKLDHLQFRRLAARQDGVRAI